MKLSIIVVSYNEAKYLRQAIDSCLFQDLEVPYEIIIGDDGSTDGSQEIIQEYLYKYPHQIRAFSVIRGEPCDVVASIRVSNVMKTAFAISEGDYLCVLSGDDYYCINSKLSTQVRFLEGNDKYASCYTDYSMVWDDGSSKVIKQRASRNRFLFWSGTYVHISCFLFRKSVLDNLLCRFCDDTGMIFSILKTGPAKHIDMIGFAYRQREKSIMHTVDRLESSIIELLLFQDIIDSKSFYYTSLSRFNYHMVICFKHRKQVFNETYSKYYKISRSTDIINVITNNDSLSNSNSPYTLLLKSSIMLAMFLVARKANYCFHIIIERLAKLMGA